MRKILGTLLKAMSFLVLILFVSLGIVIASRLPQHSLPSNDQVMVYIGVGIVGILLFLLVYACGQSVQTLVRLSELQTASYNSQREIVTFLHDQTTPNPFARDDELMRPGESLLDDSAADWRRTPPPLEEEKVEFEESPPVVTTSQEPPPQIYCSLCGTIQDARQHACIHCGASFVEDMSA